MFKPVDLAEFGAHLGPRMVLGMEEPILGYRIWYADFRQVLGLYGGLWPKPKLQAVCGDGQMHSSPGTNCKCGIHVAFNPRIAASKRRRVSLMRFLVFALVMLSCLGLTTAFAVLKPFPGPESVLVYLAVWGLGCLFLGYAIANPSIFEQSMPEITGVVCLTGKVLVYPEGARGEYARVLCLLKTRGLGAWLAHYWGYRWKVPVFDFKDTERIRAYCTEHGTFGEIPSPKE